MSVYSGNGSISFFSFCVGVIQLVVGSSVVSLTVGCSGAGVVEQPARRIRDRDRYLSFIIRSPLSGTYLISVEIWVEFQRKGFGWVFSRVEMF